MRSLLVLAACAVALPAQAQISTDRPGLGFSPSVVPRGAVQVEAGLPQATRVEGPEVAGARATFTSYAFPVALRYGLTEAVELRASTSVYDVARVSVDTPLGGGSESEGNAGFDLVELGAKIQLATNGPVVALIPSVQVPTTEAGSLSAAFRTVAGWAIADRLDLTTTLGATVTDGDPDVSVAGEAAAVLTASLADAVSAYGEVGAFPADGGTPVLAGGGVLVLLSPDVQLDASFDVGLTAEAPDLLFGAGLSFRF